MPRRLAASLLALLTFGPLAAADDSGPLLNDLRAARTDAVRASAAWDRLVGRGPGALPEILGAMDTPDTVVANWLRTAFDRVVDDALRPGGPGVDADVLLKVVQDPRRQGRVRRLALEVVDRVRPGTSARLIPGWLDDPEFRYEAVEEAVRRADALAAAGQKEAAADEYRRAFTAARDLKQAQTLAAKLKALGVAVSVAEHLGFLTDWYVIGPFDGHGMKGFHTAYPPEQKVDLAAELPGKEGTLRWKHFQVKEAVTATSARGGLVNLLEPLGHAEDAVAYAYTALRVPHEQEVEFRGAADDNLTVWVNGHKEFGFEEYRNGVRLDRHRFRVRLRPGVNTVLVKVCQAANDPTNSDPNWEFLLRLVDADGRGVAFPTALPAAP